MAERVLSYLPLCRSGCTLELLAQDVLHATGVSSTSRISRAIDKLRNDFGIAVESATISSGKLVITKKGQRKEYWIKERTPLYEQIANKVLASEDAQ
jgi:hypothetical protein